VGIGGCSPKEVPQNVDMAMEGRNFCRTRILTSGGPSMVFLFVFFALHPAALRPWHSSVVWNFGGGIIINRVHMCDSSSKKTPLPISHI
jgi:hypothetical protein